MADRTVFNEIIGVTVELEGGHSLNPNDTGNWTGGAIGSGELKGTKYGISAASYPHLDIANLTVAEAKRIYYRDYWLAGSCDLLPDPLAFLHFDSIVQHGAYNASEMLGNSERDPWVYFSVRLAFYASRKQFFQDDGDPTNDFGRGWVRRMSKVGRIMAELERGMPTGWKLVLEAPDGERTIYDLGEAHHVVQRVALDRRRVYLSVKE